MAVGPGALLAHGGTVGAAFEIGFILIPVVIFVFLARWSKRKQELEADEEGGEDAVAEETVADGDDKG